MQQQINTNEEPKEQEKQEEPKEQEKQEEQEEQKDQEEHKEQEEQKEQKEQEEEEFDELDEYYQLIEEAQLEEISLGELEEQESKEEQEVEKEQESQQNQGIKQSEQKQEQDKEIQVEKEQGLKEEHEQKHSSVKPTIPRFSTKLPSSSLPKSLNSSASLSNIRSFKSIQASNPLSIRPNYSSKVPSTSKITPPIPRSNISTAPKSLGPPTKPPSKFLTKSVSSSLSKSVSSSLSKSVSPATFLAPPQPATKTSTKPPTRSLPSKPCATQQAKRPIPPFKSSSVTPSKPARPSTLTPTKAASIAPSKPTISRTTSALSIEKPHSLANSERPKTPKTPKSTRTPKTPKILDSQISPPIDQSPQPATKSSSAFREMLAQAKRNRPQPQNATTSSDPNLTIDPPKDADPWGLPPIVKVIEKAQRTGKLNASSRMMVKVPNEIYANLLSNTSIFHPSNRPSTTTNSDQASHPVVDLCFSARDDDESSKPVAWYETLPIIHLNFSLNELSELEEDFGGFEALTRCDLHGNQLKRLPASFGLLINLTYLDLSANQLVQFPIPIMSLVNLQQLNLSKNKLTRLWPVEWKPTLKSQLASALRPPSSTHHDSREGDQSFSSIDQPSTIADSSFAQDEFNRDGIEEQDDVLRRKTREPFPNLKILQLNGNKFTASSLLGSDSVQLPINLLDLDLSENPLGGVPIDISINLGNLKKLVKLNLCKCELQDEFFCKGDLDELSEEEEISFFTELKELDLSHNSIDSLGPLELFVEENCNRNNKDNVKHGGDGYRRINYQGLPPELVKIIQPQRPAIESGSELKVMIRNNFLRQEAKRRRKLYATQAITMEQEQTNVVPAVAVGVANSSQCEHDNGENEGKSMQFDHEDEPTVTHPTQKKKQPNPTEKVLVKHFNANTCTINLEGLQLSELSDDQNVYDDMIVGQAFFSSCRVEKINLSKNQLTKIPIELIHSFSNTLTVLNLSRNRLVYHTIDSNNNKEEGLNLNIIGEKFRLNELIELNLSSNFLAGSLKPIIHLILNQFKCFNLKVLDLSSNRFENLDGLFDLLNLLEFNNQNQNQNEMHLFNLDRILLDGNQINQIDDLIKFATQTHDNFPHLFSSSPTNTPTATTTFDKQRLFIDHISLADNSIQQLPFILGFLPIHKLDVARNLFRFPNRNVYDGPGGNVKILTWLRDRFSSTVDH